MKPSIRNLASVVALAVLLTACSSTNERATTATAVEQPPSDQAMKALSAEVFTYGYPLVLMDVTREVMTARTPAIHLRPQAQLPGCHVHRRGQPQRR